MPTTTPKRPKGRIEPPDPAGLLLPSPTPDDLRALQSDLSRQAGRDLSAREMGEWLGYHGRGIADRRWREYLAGRPVEAHRWTLAMLSIGRHPTHQLKNIVQGH